MVRTGITRAKKFIANNNPMAIFLQTKKQRNRTQQVFDVQAAKDIAGKAIIDTYDLDIRLKALAFEGWRELYFMGYFNQKVLRNE